jgi:phage terminase small subunit
MAKNNRKLTARQQRFIEEYLISNNALDAAIKAGYSQKTAKQIGYENLTKPYIKQIIDIARQDRAQKQGITADRVAEELGMLAFVKPTDALNEDGTLKSINELPEAVQRSIIGFDVETVFDKDGKTFQRVKKVRFANKNQSLDSLADWFGMKKGKGANVPEEIGVIMYPSNGKHPSEEGDE